MDWSGRVRIAGRQMHPGFRTVDAAVGIGPLPQDGCEDGTHAWPGLNAVATFAAKGDDRSTQTRIFSCPEQAAIKSLSGTSPGTPYYCP